MKSATASVSVCFSVCFPVPSVFCICLPVFTFLFFRIFLSGLRIYPFFCIFLPVCAILFLCLCLYLSVSLPLSASLYTSVSLPHSLISITSQKAFAAYIRIQMFRFRLNSNTLWQTIVFNALRGLLIRSFRRLFLVSRMALLSSSM